MSTTSAGSVPMENLEQRANEERRVLLDRATELKSKVNHVRENLDLNHNARRYFGSSAAVLAGVGLLLGYAVAGWFTDH